MAPELIPARQIDVPWTPLLLQELTYAVPKTCIWGGIPPSFFLDVFSVPGCSVPDFLLHVSPSWDSVSPIPCAKLWTLGSRPGWLTWVIPNPVRSWAMCCGWLGSLPSLPVETHLSWAAARHFSLCSTNMWTAVPRWAYGYTFCSCELDMPDTCSWKIAGEVPSPTFATSLLLRMFFCWMWALFYWSSARSDFSSLRSKQKKALCLLAHTSDWCVIFNSACYRTPKS